ncbi:unnamed protein product, partial [Ectocarpus sp. 8 AP-2014]
MYAGNHRSLIWYKVETRSAIERDETNRWAVDGCVYLFKPTPHNTNTIPPVRPNPTSANVQVPRTQSFSRNMFQPADAALATRARTASIFGHHPPASRHRKPH